MWYIPTLSVSLQMLFHVVHSVKVLVTDWAGEGCPIMGGPLMSEKVVLHGKCLLADIAGEPL